MIIGNEIIIYFVSSFFFFRIPALFLRKEWRIGMKKRRKNIIFFLKKREDFVQSLSIYRYPISLVQSSVLVQVSHLLSLTLQCFLVEALEHFI